MTRASKLLIFTLLITVSTTLLIAAPKTPQKQIAAQTTAPKIQVAILLDVSGSMNGLIEQAKAQLWNMVSVMGKAQCNGRTPQLEIALYEYGRTTNPVKDGYVKRITPFITDLDSLSGELFKLTTDGGDEYCGQVMYTALSDLQWDSSNSSYKVIFIAGNEDFLQGSLHWTKACEEAKKKGVVVNTIYCGDKAQGVREHWNLSAECGTGSYTNINHNAIIEDIPTPYDSTLFVLNNQLNNTYIAYGYRGTTAATKQAQMDVANYEANKSAAAKRITVKGNKSLYRNTEWDLVDAYEADSTVVNKVDMKTLPPSLQSKSRKELLQLVQQKGAERNAIQKRITDLAATRDTYLAKERAKGAKTATTLESEVEKIIRQQVKAYNMTIQ